MSIAVTSAVRSARGAERVPVTAPWPLALPLIWTGPAWKGPSARHWVFKASGPRGSKVPWALADALSPSSEALAMAMTPPA